MASVRNAVFFAALSKYSLSVLGLVSTIVVARLLTPAEVGLFAIASSVVMLLGEVRLLGAGVYLVREAELTAQKVRSVMGLTILISCSLGLILILAAPRVAVFYGIPEIAPIFWILSVSFITAPLISVPAALLSREFAYQELFVIRVVTALAALISTIVLVLLGFSFYGLAWAHTISMLVQVAVTVYYTPDNMVWRPSFRGFGPILKVGLFSSAGNIIKRTQTTLPDLIIGKVGTTAMVGLFSRGLGFIEFLSQSMVMGVSPVALPYLSRVKREGQDLVAAYTRSTLLLGALVWPVLAVASLVSFPAIRLFFGDQWDAAAPIAALLAFWALFRSVHAFSQQVLISARKETLMLQKEVLILGIYLGGMLLVAPQGLLAIALLMVGAAVADCVISTLVLKVGIGLSVRQFCRAMVPNVLLTAICWIATWMLGLWVDFNRPEDVLPAILTVALVLPWVWLLGLALLKHPLFDEVLNIKRWALHRLQQWRIRPMP